MLRIALLGALTGLMAGVIVLLFRYSIELGQIFLLPEKRIGNYEGLPGWLRFIFPLVGAVILGLAFERLSVTQRSVGIVHVLDYIRYRRERLPFSNTLAQFFGGIVAIVSGHSVDREGPAVHLGASNSALLGKRFSISDDEHYLFAAAGGAAAIAAAYNTPLAGVIFVIEVFRVRYTLHFIIPIIVASVTGTIISQLVYGQQPAFIVPAVSIGSLSELPVIMLMGLMIGLIAAGFIKVCSFIAHHTLSWRPLISFVIAGAVTGLLAQWSPGIMGVSYDAINRILLNEIGFSALLLLLLAKFAATAVCIGARIPGGLIGPSLVLGGAMGGLMQLLVEDLYPIYQGSTGFYAMLGMVAMMGAILRAPLAALVALMELTGNLNIILPGMLAVVTAEIATRGLVGDQSVFTALLKVKHEREAFYEAHPNGEPDRPQSVDDDPPTRQ